MKRALGFSSTEYPRYQLSVEEQQALFDWLGTPSADVAEPLALYELVLEAGEESDSTLAPDGLDQLFDLHDDALADGGDGAADGIALGALISLGYQPPQTR